MLSKEDIVVAKAIAGIPSVEAVREIAYERTTKAHVRVCPGCGADCPKEFRLTFSCAACWTWAQEVDFSRGLTIVDRRDAVYERGVQLRAAGKLPPLAKPVAPSSPVGPFLDYAYDEIYRVGAMVPVPVDTIIDIKFPPVATPRSPHTPTLAPWSPEEPETLILGTSLEGLARLHFFASAPVKSELTARTEPGMSVEQAARIREIAWAGKSGDGSTMPKQRAEAEALAAAVFEAAKVGEERQ